MTNYLVMAMQQKAKKVQLNWYMRIQTNHLINSRIMKLLLQNLQTN